MEAPDLSVVITVDNRSSIAHRTINSAKRAAAFAAKADIRSEIIVVAGGPDDRMRAYLREWNEGLIICEADAGDLGEARNAGVKLARGKFVSFLDSGNLLSEPWLRYAYESAAAGKRLSVWHPMYSHEFENACKFVRHESSLAPDFNLGALLEYDLWTDVMFVPRELLARHPFQPCPAESGFSHETRRWYCEVLAEDVPVRIVDRTSAFIRAKFDEGQRHRAPGVMPPAALFDRESSTPALPRQDAIATVQHRAPLAERLKSWGLCHVRQLRSRSSTVGKLIGLARRLQRRLADIMLFTRAPEQHVVREVLPDWFIDQWKAVHAVEPDVFPDRWILDGTYLHHFPAPRIAGPYSDLRERFGGAATHVFLVPWLVKAGADLVVMNYVRAVCERQPAEGVVVIATENIDSPWAAALPPGVRFVEFGKRYGCLDDEAQIALLLRLLLQQAPRVIHNINSRLGYHVFVRHGRSLRQGSRLFACAFCDNISAEGKLVGYVFHDLADCFDDLTMVFSDNQRVLDELHDVFALDPAKMAVHYQPTELSARRQRSRRPAGAKSLDVLWAGRLDRQKRPDILAEIARRCRPYPFRFHVYGYTCLEPAAESIRGAENVTWYGPYASFKELAMAEFDVFLHTAQWDGVPNTLLEGMAAGIPVVASNVGGIGEVVLPGKTGFLIDPFDDVDGYVRALASIHENRADADRMRDNGLELISRRHSWQTFLQHVAAAPDYLSTAEIRRRAA